MAVIKSQLISIVLICALSALLVISFSQAAAISRFPSVSLRYNTPITGHAAHAARQHAIANSDTGQAPFWPTFWRQDTAKLTAGIRTAQVPAISFSGDASLVWHAPYIAGTAPGAVDGAGLAVSEALAHALWGSTDIVGMTVYVDDTPRTIRGVFAGADSLALVPFHI
ncbi:MAG: hypothetical protein FWG38_05695, partial [Defluviitaleaceae bacterium]|nr:hypothetical protein [Defluviitaleaceae bacterium]